MITLDDELKYIGLFASELHSKNREVDTAVDVSAILGATSCRARSLRCAGNAKNAVGANGPADEISRKIYAANVLEGIYDDSSFFSARYLAGSVLGKPDYELAQRVMSWSSDLKSTIDGIMPIRGSNNHARKKTNMLSDIEGICDEREESMDAMHDLALLYIFSGSHVARNILAPYSSGDDPELKKIAQEALAYKGDVLSSGNVKMLFDRAYVA